MNPFCRLMLVALIASTPILAADSPAHSWFQNEYAPLWKNEPGENIQKLTTFYENEITTYEADGSISRESRNEWLVEPMQEWLADGWISAELDGLATIQFSESTATFLTRWVDKYEGGEQETSCSWYLAHQVDGQWRFAAYADADCDRLD